MQRISILALLFCCNGFVFTLERSCFVNTEFKIYDATVTKTSFNIASSGLSIFFVIMSVCLTLKN